MWPDMPGADIRSCPASSEAVIPGFRLIWISSETCPPVTPSDWASRLNSRDSRSSTGRSWSASVRALGEEGRAFVIGIINLLNYSAKVALFTQPFQPFV